MDVWVTYSKRKSLCPYCNSYVTAGNPVLITQQYNKGPGGKRFRSRKYWHPNCWMDNAMYKLSQNAYPGRPGRPRMLQLSPEDSAKRLAILRKRARCIQRLKIAIKNGSVDTIIRLSEAIENTKEEIKPYGGVPKSWERLKS